MNSRSPPSFVPSEFRKQLLPPCSRPQCSPGCYKPRQCYRPTMCHAPKTNLPQSELRRAQCHDTRPRPAALLHRDCLPEIGSWQNQSVFLISREVMNVRRSEPTNAANISLRYVTCLRCAAIIACSCFLRS